MLMSHVIIATVTVIVYVLAMLKAPTHTAAITGLLCFPI